MRIAVIPARGGSKRIPRKNIKEFYGKPMIAWSIEAAKNSGVFDRIIVSTDDIEIAAISKHYGAEVPFMRPCALSDDHTGTTAVIAHAAQWAFEEGLDVDAICCIYATAPFLQIGDLQRGLQLLSSGKWRYAFSATEYAAPIFRSFVQSAEGGVEMLFPEHFSTRSQDFPKALHDAGQFYWGHPRSWVDGSRVFDRYSMPVIIPRWRVQDIDDHEDWKRAELTAPFIMGRIL